MGNSTIIELNHDQWMDIFESEETQKQFLSQIREQFSAFRYNRQYILGGKVIAGFHRSGKIYKDWTNFKKKLDKHYEGVPKLRV